VGHKTSIQSKRKRTGKKGLKGHGPKHGYNTLGYISADDGGGTETDSGCERSQPAARALRFPAGGHFLKVTAPVKLQALVNDIPPTTAIIDYAIGL